MSERLPEAHKEIDVKRLSAEQRVALHRSLEAAVENGEEHIIEYVDFTAPRKIRRHEHTLHRIRRKAYFTKKVDDDPPHSGLSLESSQVASKTRKSLFQPFEQSAWSPPEYHATYFYDYDKYTFYGSPDIVRFDYWPGLGRISISGKEWLFAELGLNDTEPLEVFIDLLKPLMTKKDG